MGWKELEISPSHTTKGATVIQESALSHSQGVQGLMQTYNSYQAPNDWIGGTINSIRAALGGVIAEWAGGNSHSLHGQGEKLFVASKGHRQAEDANTDLTSSI